MQLLNACPRACLRKRSIGARLLRQPHWRARSLLQLHIASGRAGSLSSLADARAARSMAWAPVSSQAPAMFLDIPGLLRLYWALAAGAVIVTILPIPVPQAFK